MDPWTILGIAANIIQFVDVGVRLVSGAKEAYNSADGVKGEIAELRMLVDDIKLSNSRILSSELSQDEQNIKKLATACEALATELELQLGRLEIKTSRIRWMESARVSVESIRKGQNIADLKLRLFNIQRQLQERVVAVLQSKGNSNLSSAIQKLQLRSSVAGIATHQKLDSALKKIDELARIQQEHLVGSDYHTFLSELATRIDEAVTHGRDAERNARIIESLWFNAIKERHDTILNAYSQTLGWLFDSNISKFPEWLQNDDGIFWINGYAGSGKSTLMKFAYADERTCLLLRDWANERKLYTAACFFWNAGGDMQKSQRGLFQTLLCQILKADPDLATSVCPNHGEREPWSREELKNAFQLLTSTESSSSCFCFFIDGLDEYSGDEHEIIEVLESLARTKNVKICCSSRPWIAFEQAFTATHRTLIVQDHTMKDMKQYVQGMLEGNLGFQELASRDKRCMELGPEIARRANGVWLWVYLVVRDLTRDISYKEEYPLLKRRLDEIPPKLEDYFDKIIRQIDPIHKGESAQIFLLALETSGILPLIFLTLLECERENPDYAIGSNLEFDNSSEILLRLMTRLKSRCRDLMIPSTSGPVDLRPWITFLHRTVRDFLAKTYRSRLSENTPKDFDARVTLCRGALALFKSRSRSLRYPLRYFHFEFPLQASDENYEIMELLFNMRKLELTGEAAPHFKLLDNLRPTGGFNDPHELHSFEDPTFSLAANLGLVQYCKHMAKQAPDLFEREKQSCLTLALTLNNNALAERELVHYLLSAGANPNGNAGKYDQTRTAFQFFIFKHSRLYNSGSGKAWFDVAKLLVEHGASLDDASGEYGARWESSEQRRKQKICTARECFSENMGFSLEQMKMLELLQEDQKHAKAGQ